MHIFMHFDALAHRFCCRSGAMQIRAFSPFGMCADGHAKKTHIDLSEDMRKHIDFLFDVYPDCRFLWPDLDQIPSAFFTIQPFLKKQTAYLSIS